MPLIVLAGRPCSGKTRLCSLLVDFLRSSIRDASNGPANSGLHGKEIVVINDETLGINKGSGYKTAAAEKISRAAHKSAIERALSKVGSSPAGSSSDASPFVIADGLNAIKGYRYELWCIAKSAGTSYACVWVEPHADVTLSRALNVVRASAPRQHASSISCGSDEPACMTAATLLDSLPRQGDSAGYYPDVHADLWSRFEPPDARNKWETPLFRVTGLMPVTGTPEHDALAELLAPLTLQPVHVPPAITPGNTASGPTLTKSTPVFTSKYAGGGTVYTSDALVSSTKTHTELQQAAQADRAERREAGIAAATGGGSSGNTVISSFRRPGLGKPGGGTAGMRHGLGSGDGGQMASLDADVANLADLDGFETNLADLEQPQLEQVKQSSGVGAGSSSSFKRAGGSGASSFRRAPTTALQSKAESGPLAGVEGKGATATAVASDSTAAKFDSPTIVAAEAAAVLQPSVLFDELTSCLFGARARVLRPHLSTAPIPVVDSSWRSSITKACGEVCAAIASSGRQADSVAACDSHSVHRSLPVSGSAVPLLLPRGAPVPSAAELSRLSREFERQQGDAVLTAHMLAGSRQGGAGLPSGLMGSSTSDEAGQSTTTSQADELKTRFVEWLSDMLCT